MLSKKNLQRLKAVTSLEKAVSKIIEERRAIALWIKNNDNYITSKMEENETLPHEATRWHNSTLVSQFLLSTNVCWTKPKL